MTIKSDIEIAQEAQPLPITDIADACGVDGAYVEQYGRYKAKIDNRFLKETDRPDGKLVLVTAITPTPAGEGKTTTTVGLADGLRRIGKNAVVALREPSLGPVFGIKGGAAGGGHAQVIPMEDINLHFTGDFHAIGAANNLLAAMLDNHIAQHRGRPGGPDAGCAPGGRIRHHRGQRGHGRAVPGIGHPGSESPAGADRGGLHL